MSIGAAVPVALTASAALSATIGPAIAELTAKLAGLGKLLLQVTVTPPTAALAAKVAAAGQVAAGLAATAAAGLPGVSLQATGLLAIIAEIELQLVALNLGLEFVGELSGLLATAGVCVHTYEGRADRFGSEFTAAFASGIPSGGGPATTVNAIVLATTSSATWIAMQGVFRT